jgi:AraC family transcriptional regulator
MQHNLNVFNELSELVTLQVNATSEVRHHRSWIEKRQHNDYDLWFVQEGELTIQVQEDVYIAKKGDIVFFSPSITYTATATSDVCTFVFTHFDLYLGDHQRILDTFQISGVIEGRIVQEESQLFLRAYNQYKKNASMSSLHLKGCVMILLAKVLELYEKGTYRGDFVMDPSNHTASMDYDKLLPVFQYIYENLDQSPQVKEIAAIAGMSEKYFIAYFKKTLGVTPGRYMYRLKMNQARELLYSKQYSIQQIANKLGYPDPYSFSKAFKKFYNIPPSKFVN